MNTKAWMTSLAPAALAALVSGCAEPQTTYVPVYRATGLCGPATLSSVRRLPGAAGSASTGRQWCAGRADRRLADANATSGSRAGASAPASTGGRAPATSRGGSNGPAAASGRGHSRGSESLLRLDFRLLGLERPLGMGEWPLGGPAPAHCCLGEWPLEPAWPRLRLD